jgi:ribosomal protein L11 methyltransferase
MKNYLEVSLTATEPIEAHVEIITAYLSEFGFEGSAEDEQVKAYIAVGEHSESDIKVLIDELIEKGLCEKAYQIEIIAPKNWNEEWEKNYFQPIIIGEQCLIKSSFHQTDLKAKYEIVIDPKMSFGTGHHETTSMMAEYILELELADKMILDMGTGTGILGILASMIGCKQVIGIDNDSWCYENAQENIEKNNIQNFEMHLGDAGLLKSYPNAFDLIIANINRHILLADIKYYHQSMHKGSTLLLSGFYESDLEDIEKECSKYGLKRIDYKMKRSWVAAQFIYQ